MKEYRRKFKGAGLEGQGADKRAAKGNVVPFRYSPEK
jgi:hypothetical protein